MNSTVTISMIQGNRPRKAGLYLYQELSHAAPMLVCVFWQDKRLYAENLGVYGTMPVSKTDRYAYWSYRLDAVKTTYDRIFGRS